MCRSILAVLTILTLTLAAEAKGQSEQPPGDATTSRLEQLVTNRRAQLGPKHRDTLHALSELADAYAQAGGADKALVLHRELFELRRDALGPKHTDTVWKHGGVVICRSNVRKMREVMAKGAREIYISGSVTATRT